MDEKRLRGGCNVEGDDGHMRIRDDEKWLGSHRERGRRSRLVNYGRSPKKFQKLQCQVQSRRSIRGNEARVFVGWWWWPYGHKEDEQHRGAHGS